MRYQVFNKRDSVKPIFSAPWYWLSYGCVNFLMLMMKGDYWFYLVDAKNHVTLIEWAVAEQPCHK